MTKVNDDKKSDVIQIRYAEEIKLNVRGKEISLSIPSAKKLSEYYDKSRDENQNPIESSLSFVIDCGMDKKTAHMLQPMELRAIVDVLAGKLQEG